MSVQPAYANEQGQEASMKRLMRRLHTGNRLATIIITIITAIVVAGFVSIIGYLIIQGWPNLINGHFYGTDGEDTVGRQIFTTFYTLIFAEIILIPVALSAAIYMVEYARQGTLVNMIRFAAETLAGVPSIVIGLFGYLVFSTTFGWGTSRIAGAMALLCLNLPIALRLFEDALMAVPREFREGGLALGATKWRTIRTVVLPSAIPGIITAIVLTMGKIIAESAVLVFTMGSSSTPLPSTRRVFNLNPFIHGNFFDTLTVRIWYVKTIGADALDANVVNSVAAGSAALLLVVLLLINIIARLIGRRIQSRFTGS